MKEKQSVKFRLLKHGTHLILELPAFLLGGRGAGLLLLAVKRYHQKQQTPGAGTADAKNRERAALKERRAAEMGLNDVQARQGERRACGKASHKAWT